MLYELKILVLIGFVTVLIQLLELQIVCQTIHCGCLYVFSWECETYLECLESVLFVVQSVFVMMCLFDLLNNLNCLSGNAVDCNCVSGELCLRNVDFA